MQNKVLGNGDSLLLLSGGGQSYLFHHSAVALCDDTTRLSHSPRQTIYGWQKFTPFENHLYRIDTRAQACVNNNIDLIRKRLMYN